MKWVTALDLQKWSQAISARTALPAMVADLIRASSLDISSYRFPSGDKGQVRGFDGHLIAAGGTFVPDGESIWEFGVGEGAAKAEKDYAKRVSELSPEDRAKIAFVFVTLQTWDNPKEKLTEWVNTKRQKGEWKDVIYLDGVALEHWLESHPAVAARYARVELALFPQQGARSVEEFWNEYSNRFKPQLTEDVLLCERQKQADELLRNLGGSATQVTIFADSPDEVIAFAVAAIRKADPAVRLFLEARTLIIDTEVAARLLAAKQGLVFLPRGQARHISGMLAQVGPTLIATGADQPNRGFEALPRPSSHNLANALKTMGLDDDKAYGLTRSSGRSVTILARLIPGGLASKPDWMADARTLVPALLAGGWDSGSTLDQDIVTILSGGMPYYEYEVQLRPFKRMQDPPLDQEQTVWKTRAPVDAFVHIGHLIGPDDLERLKTAASTVFSVIEPPPDPNEPFQLEPRRLPTHSLWLRDGLATTLLMIAALADQASLIIPGRTAQDYVDEIVRGLPGLATDYRVIASLKSQLPLLAEAAPSPFLSALEHMLEGDGDAMKLIFSEADHFFAPSSPHTDLLWALETLAWDPVYLSRVSMILAKLARVDPGGRLANRPINSLRAIFLSWLPSTNAPLDVRLAALDAIVKKETEVGWALLTKLLPRGHDSSSPTAKPRFRESGASEREVVTWSRVWESQREIVTRALTLAEEDASRWCTIVESLSNFEPNLRSRALDLLDAYLTKAPDQARLRVWANLRDELNRHRAFADTDWALRENDLARMDEVVRRHEPSDLIERVKWLFDDWSPDIPGQPIGSRDLAETKRREAITQIFEHGGTSAVLDLAERAKLPQFVAQSAVEIATGPDLPWKLIIGALGRSDHMNHFAMAVSAASSRKFDNAWVELFKRMAEEQAWSPDAIATLLLAWPDRRETWSVAEQFGEQTEQNYWRRKTAWLIQGDARDAEYVARQYLKVGRPSAALEALYERISDVPLSLVFNLLDAAVSEINEHPDRMNNMFVYHVEEIFKALESRNDVPKIEIARREYAYLPMFGYGMKELTLHRLMSESPEFYVSVLSDVFRKATKDLTVEAEPSAEARNRARAGYQLLSSFARLPGLTNWDLDPEALRTWVLEVRRLGAESDRAKITDQYVGRILAHAPLDPLDGAWPHRQVRGLIETLESDEVERGITVERFNMRGVYTKAVYEGGKQERELAEQYRQWARSSSSWLRTSSMLMGIARSWDQEAIEADVRARQDQMRE